MPSSAYFNITCGSNAFSVKTPSNKGAIEWIEDIKSVLFDEVADKVQTPGVKPGNPKNPFAQFVSGDGGVTVSQEPTLHATPPPTEGTHDGVSAARSPTDGQQQEPVLATASPAGQGPLPLAERMKKRKEEDAEKERAALVAADDKSPPPRPSAPSNQTSSMLGTADGQQQQQQQQLGQSTPPTPAQPPTQGLEPKLNASTAPPATPQPGVPQPEPTLDSAPPPKPPRAEPVLQAPVKSSATTIVLDRSNGKSLGIKLLKANDDVGFIIKSVDVGGQAEKFPELTVGRRITHVNQTDVTAVPFTMKQPVNHKV